jgi:hypothetical protein
MAPVALLLSVLAAAGAGWALLKPTPTPEPPAMFAGNPTATDPKAEACKVAELVAEGVARQSRADLGPEPVALETVAANTRLAMAGGAAYLREATPSNTPADAGHRPALLRRAEQCGARTSRAVDGGDRDDQEDRRKLPLRAALVTAAVATLLCAAPAAAEPALPPPPPPPAPPIAPPAPAGLIPALGGLLAQAGSPPAGPLGLPDLSGYAPNLLLGQNAAPAPPGSPPAAVPDLRALNPDYLLPQNLAPAAPAEGTPAPGLAPSQDIPGTGRIDFLRRLYEMYEAGALRGALLGQLPPEQFGSEPAPPG